MPFHGFQHTASITIITNDLIIKAGTHLLAFGVEKTPFLSNITFWNSGFVQRVKGKTFCLIFFLEKWVCEDLFERNSFPPPSWRPMCWQFFFLSLLQEVAFFSKYIFEGLSPWLWVNYEVIGPHWPYFCPLIFLPSRSFFHRPCQFFPPMSFFTDRVIFVAMTFFPICRGCAADDFLSLCLKTAQFVGLEGKILRKMFSPVNYCCLPSLPSSSLLPHPDSWIK